MTKPPPPEMPAKTPPAKQPSASEEARPEPVRVTAATCVRCGRPVAARHRPFCSQRCADIDLGQWASGSYRIPTAETPAGPDDEDS
jgi:endogenous inhibitor of DNA gyrase (YacG/DUF329 family)